MRTNSFTVSDNQSNILVSWKKNWIVLIFIYYLFYQVFIPIAINYGDIDPLNIAIKLSYNFVLFAPIFILWRKPNFGLLHPLSFPVIFSIAVGVLREPLKLLFPMVEGSAAKRFESHPLLVGSHQSEILELMLKCDLLDMLAILMTYLGFFSFYIRPKYVKNQIKGLNKTFLYFLFSISLVVLLYFLQRQGGLANHIISFAYGRFKSLSGTGHFRVIAQIGLLVGLVWFAIDKKALKNPLYWPIFIFAFGHGFIMSGSRSSIFVALIQFGLIWMMHHQKLPTGYSLLLGFLVLVSIGPLGELRRMGRTDEKIDIEKILSNSIAEQIKSTEEEISARSSGFTAVVKKGISDEGLLWGRTYLGAIFFWVPRAIWPDKPRGAGAYTGTLLYRNNDLEDNSAGGEGGGIPPGPVGEAYWNFHIPGVIIMFLLFGASLRYFLNLLITNKSNKFVWVLYILVITRLDPSTISLVTFSQLAASLLLIWWIGWRPKRFNISHAPLAS
jgi:oligosaccharide repeat unit polymerase